MAVSKQQFPGRRDSEVVVTDKYWRRSDVEQEIQHVAVFDDVILPFGAHLAGFLRALFAAAGDEVVEGDGLRADEAALEVAVDHARRLRRGVADVDRPGAHLLRPGGEVGLQAEQLDRKSTRLNSSHHSISYAV